MVVTPPLPLAGEAHAGGDHRAVTLLVLVPYRSDVPGESEATVLRPLRSAAPSAWPNALSPTLSRAQEWRALTMILLPRD